MRRQRLGQEDGISDGINRVSRGSFLDNVVSAVHLAMPRAASLGDVSVHGLVDFICFPESLTARLPDSKPEPGVVCQAPFREKTFARSNSRSRRLRHKPPP